MSKNSLDIKELLKGIIIVGMYFILPILLIMPFILLFIPHSSLGTQQLILNLVSSLVLIIIYFKDLKNDLNKYKKDFKKYFIVSLKYWLVGLIIMLLSTYIFNLTGLDTSINQSNNNVFLKSYPFHAIICSTILAPITEELIFRRSFKNISNNIHIYSFITGIIFGSIHVLPSLSNPLMLLHLIPYCSVGISLGYAYKKTNNIYSSLIIHIIHNIITIIYLFLGGI